MPHSHGQTSAGGGCCSTGANPSMNAPQPQAQTGSVSASAPIGITAPGALGLIMSPRAIAKAKDFIASNNTPGHALRVSVVGGGCSGLSYRLELDDQIGENDRSADYDGVKVVTDPKSLMSLVGTEIDYVEGLQGAGFTFKNPNAKGGCGCGSSFSA